jgi:hypothetical protein
MNHEQGIRTSYQALLSSIEAFILGLIFTFYQLEYTLNLWLLPLGGIIICIFFGIPCEYRARNVDFWRNSIVKLVKDTDLQEPFMLGKYNWIPLGRVGLWSEYLFGHWFERILISFLLIAWLIILVIMRSPWIIVVLGVSATIFWILYAFSIRDFSGKPMFKEQTGIHP